jgi:excisionase family DNA binding protein
MAIPSRDAPYLGMAGAPGVVMAEHGRGTNKPRGGDIPEIDLRRLFFEHPEDFVDVSECAAALKKAETTVRRWVAYGKLRGVRVGRTLWIYRPSLQAAIEEAGE